MDDLKARIRGAEAAAETVEDPIAALFKRPRKVENPTEVPMQSISQTGQGTTLRDLPVDLLDEMEQPFRLYTDKKLEQMRDSIAAHGIIQRIIVRPYPIGSGRYQIISGRNRRRAAILAGYVMVPCEIRDLDDDEAELQMITTNLDQRDELLPSEKAKAYQIRLKVLAHQGKRTSAQIEQKLSIEVVAEETNDSRPQVQRYIRLTYLIPELLETVDNGALGFNAGVSLSYLSAESQTVVYQYFFADHKQKISGNLADALRFAGEKEPITEELITRILSPAVKSKPLNKVSVTMRKLRSYFSPEATPKEIEKQIIEILTEYFSKRGGQV